jgi:hypothetical protein
VTVLTVLAVTWSWAAAAPSNLPNTAALEIAHLFDYLATSECTFIRNGRAHSAQEAVAHLERKYRYLLERNLVTSPEAFIERAASRSSLTGIAYRVACPGAAVQESAAWFEAELARLRRGGGPR